jgi:hypothetical protein
MRKIVEDLIHSDDEEINIINNTLKLENNVKNDVGEDNSSSNLNNLSKIQNHIKDPHVIRLHALIKDKLNSDNLGEFFEYILKLENKDKEFFKNNKIINLFNYINDFIFKNLHQANLYSLFEIFKKLLSSVKQNENLRICLELEDEDFSKKINTLDEAMTNIIEKQKKMKNSRRNLKTKMRLQRKVSELRNQLEELKKK